ncbi:pentapeptide repeat-containing protein [Nocardia terpenica]|uniref:pentapeptide repeat-containing protein n=1 Tax=Nocardia terpenica TaxID=455432 RepID=UPI002FE0B60E
MRSRFWRTVGVTALLAVGVVGVGWFAVAVLPGWAVGHDAAGLSVAERVAALNTARGHGITLISALGALVVAGFGIDRHFLDKDKQRLEHDKQRLDQDKHLTGLFDTATARLAAAEPISRAGGVRTLFRLMAASPPDHPLVVASICDMLRLHAVAGRPDGRLPADLIAGVEALRDRPIRPESRPLDLIGVRLPESDWRGARLIGARFADATSHADLRGADLTNADLTAAECSGTGLQEAILRGAVLTRTDFTEADLTEASLTDADAVGARLANALLLRADLRGANFRGADLRRARLRGARLGAADGIGTDLTDADLTDTDLTGTDLREVRGLTDAAVRAAVVDGETKLPAGVAHPRLPRDRPR